jgi:hypothetical protein
VQHSYQTWFNLNSSYQFSNFCYRNLSPVRNVDSIIILPPRMAVRFINRVYGFQSTSEALQQNYNPTKKVTALVTFVTRTAFLSNCMYLFVSRRYVLGSGRATRGQPDSCTYLAYRARTPAQHFCNTALSTTKFVRLTHTRISCHVFITTVKLLFYNAHGCCKTEYPNTCHVNDPARLLVPTLVPEHLIELASRTARLKCDLEFSVTPTASVNTSRSRATPVTMRNSKISIFPLAGSSVGAYVDSTSWGSSGTLSAVWGYVQNTRMVKTRSYSHVTPIILYVVHFARSYIRENSTDCDESPGGLQGQLTMSVSRLRFFMRLTTLSLSKVIQRR